MANRDNHDKAMLKALQDIARELKRMNNGNNQAIVEDVDNINTTAFTDGYNKGYKKAINEAYEKKFVDGDIETLIKWLQVEHIKTIIRP